jgi:2-polyprenyl-3-methyl-5-hydroxy-6-metoxy-1,4-benzoquinol methylase
MDNKEYKHKDYYLRSGDQYALAKYNIIRSWLPRVNHLKVLNAGCGSGEMNIILSNNKTWLVDAIDVDNKAINLSLELKNKLSINNLNIIKSSIEDFESIEHSYDIIVSNDVLEHISDDLNAIKKFAFLIRPKGKIFISVPSFQWLFGYHDEMLGHYRRYTKASFTKKLSKFFEVEYCRYFGMSLVPLALFYSRYLRKNYPSGLFPLNDLNNNSIKTNLLQKILEIESLIQMPVGTSLLVQASLSE